MVKSDPVLTSLVVVATPTLQFGGIAGNFAAGVSRPIYATGVVVEDQDRMREWNEYELRDISRRLTLSGTAADSAVIGTGVARVLQLCVALKVPVPFANALSGGNTAWPSLLLKCTVPP